MLSLGLAPDQKSLDDLFSALDKAYFYTKRSPAEFCNTALYFILKGAIAFTPRSNKTKIRSSLLVNSRVAPTAPLAAILVNTNAPKGLKGADMAVAVEKLIGTRQSRAVYIASRWIPALKIIEPATKYHSGAARPPSNVKNFHHFDGGDALAAKEGTDPKGFILAVLDKANNEEAAGKILNIGLNEAIRRETDAQLQYAAEKMWAEPMSLLFG